MARLLRDERGAVAVQTALFLPILIIIVIGSFELWKVAYVQQVLNDAAYQGVRLMVMQANSQEIDVPWRTERLIRRYVSTCPFVDPALKANPENEELLDVSIQYYPPRCGETVSIEVIVPWVVGREWRARPNSSDWLSFLGARGRLIGRAEGAMLCIRQEDVTGVGP